MFKILHTELLKFKRGKILWLVPLGAFVAAFLTYMMLTQTQAHIHSIPWNSFFKNLEFLMNALVGPALFSLMAGFIVAQEYQNNTINQLFTYPTSRLKFLLGKTIIMIGIIAATFILAFIFTLGFGFIAKTDGPLTADIAWKHAQLFLRMIPMHFAWIPIAMTASMLGKNYIPPMAIGIGAVFFNIVIASSKYVSIFPYSVPFAITNALEGVQKVDYLKGIISLSLTFLIPFIFNLFYYAKSDVHSG
ncbi:MAG TPA: ABC transporter permease [Anaerolineae bacterium]|jgi:hypothetical protein|nr:ABC transporter permease [Anaerolineae bacterium]